MWDFLDTVNEHGAEAGPMNGLQLHLALVEALDLDRPISDYYRHHPWREDGYLRTLVEVCRKCAGSLPCFARVRPHVVMEAIRAQVLALNHDLDPARRDTSLSAWAEREFPAGHHETAWYELSGAASASMTVHALLALAAEPGCTDTDIARASAAYFPWISAATTMLDSYVDQHEDRANSDHSYVAHYPSPEAGWRRVRYLVHRSMSEAHGLTRGEYHKVLVACMVAMYLSKDSARTNEMRETAGSFVNTGGTLTRFLLPILRLWRAAYAQRSA